MSEKLNLQSYYITGEVTGGFTIFNALTDHAILSEVSVREASDFFWSNDPTHPALSRLTKYQRDSYQYDYFNNYDLELNVCKDNYEESTSYDFYDITPGYQTAEEWNDCYKDLNFVIDNFSDKQLELNFSNKLNSDSASKFTKDTGVSVTIPKPFKVVKDENGLAIATKASLDSFDDLPILDSDED